MKHLLLTAYDDNLSSYRHTLRKDDFFWYKLYTGN